MQHCQELFFSSSSSFLVAVTTLLTTLEHASQIQTFWNFLQVFQLNFPIELKLIFLNSAVFEKFPTIKTVFLQLLIF